MPTTDTINSKDLRYNALLYLVGRPIWGWVKRNHMAAVLEMAEKIKSRRERRGKSIKKTVCGYDFRPSEPKSGGCSYCWPENASIHYTTGRVSRRRMNNPKYLDRCS